MLVREMVRNVYKECKGVAKGNCLTKEQRLSLQNFCFITSMM